MRGLKSTIIGLFLILIGLSIFILSYYVMNDLKLVSTPSFLIFIFSITGILSMIGKDKLIDKFYEAINGLINRIKR